MSFQFYPPPTGDEKAARLSAQQFSNESLRPFALEDDAKSFFRRDAFKKAASLGLTSFIVPKLYGGKEQSNLCHYGALEEVAKASVSMSVVMGVTNLTQGGLLTLGNEEQKRTYLPRLVSGEWLGAFSLSEPQAGSDAGSLRLSAKKVSGGYRLTGTKLWCSNAGHADLYWVMGRTSEDRIRGISGFLVEKNDPGFRVGKQEKKLGLRASSLAELIFEDCFIPENRRLGLEGEGLIGALKLLDAGRIAIGVAGLGVATEALETVWKYRDELAKTQGREFAEGERLLFTDLFCELQGAKLIARQAAEEKDQGRRFTTLASQTKLWGSDLAMKATSLAVTLAGEAGYLKENHWERLMRDAKALQIVEGTNQVQRNILVKEIGNQLT